MSTAITPEQWKQLSYREQNLRWPTLNEAERAAITQDEKFEHLKAGWLKAEERKPYRAPAVCIVLYVLALLGVGGSVLLLTFGQFASAVAAFIAVFSLIAWGQMLDYIARTAFHAERTAELLAQQVRSSAPR